MVLVSVGESPTVFFGSSKASFNTQWRPTLSSMQRRSICAWHYSVYRGNAPPLIKTQREDFDEDRDARAAALRMSIKGLDKLLIRRRAEPKGVRGRVKAMSWGGKYASRNR